MTRRGLMLAGAVTALTLDRITDSIATWTVLFCLATVVMLILIVKFQRPDSAA